MPRGYAAKRVVTCDPARASALDPLGVITDGVLVVDEERITWVGTRQGAPQVPVEDCGELLTPGLVDAHTHACWAGSRHDEYAVRMGGGDYEAIAKSGGGIVATQAAVASASEQELFHLLRGRLRRMAALGVTCVEVKSGYGLEPDQELKQLRAIARASKDTSLPSVVPTFLALHALPKGTARDGYVRHVVEELVPRVAEAGLAEFVDAYVDANAFRVD